MTSSVTILLLDEEPMLRRATALMLSNRGGVVSAAGSLDEALSLMSERIFDVAVIELSEKGPRASEVLERMRSQALLPRRVVVCANQPLSRAEAQGCSVALERPYPFERLLVAVFGPACKRRPSRSGVFQRVRACALLRARQAAMRGSLRPSSRTRVEDRSDESPERPAPSSAHAGKDPRPASRIYSSRGAGEAMRAAASLEIEPRRTAAAAVKKPRRAVRVRRGRV